MRSEIKNINDLIGSEIKIMLCFLIKNEKYSLSEIVELFENKYKKKMKRETIYRILERMLISNFLEKTYSKERKCLVYYLKIQKVIFNFIDENITFEAK